MKKLTIFLLALIFGLYSYGQAVDDEAIIPVSITLNSILRLNVTSGGNIEFVFNNIDQYKSGIANSTRYDTEFNVSSSIDFDVILTPEDASNLNGTDDPSHAMPINYLRMAIAKAGGNSSVTPAAATPLTVGTASYEIVACDGTNSNAGDAGDNSFTIHWDVSAIIDANIAADRYTNNMFLSLIATTHPIP